MITNYVDLNSSVSQNDSSLPMGVDKRITELHIQRLLNGLSDDVIKMLSMNKS